jgi:hypothetical protein
MAECVWFGEPDAITERLRLTGNFCHGAQVPHRVGICRELRDHWHGRDTAGQPKKREWYDSETEVHRCDSLDEDGLSRAGFSHPKTNDRKASHPTGFQKDRRREGPCA